TVSGYTLATLDAGAINLDDDPSPGRRVMLPWGGTTFDVANLTTAGLTILRRALEWASVATEGGGGGGPPCTGNLNIDLERTSFDVTTYGLPKAVAYVPSGVSIAGSPLPAAGGWVLLNPTVDRLDFVTIDGVLLDSVFLAVGEKLNGISFIENGPHQGHLALTGTDEESQQSSVVIVDVAGNLTAHWKLGLPKQTGIAYIDDGGYAGHFILTSTTGATLVDDNANVVGTLPYALPLDNVRSIEYLPGGNLVAVANKTDSDVHILELSGTLPNVSATTINQWDTAAFGVVDPKDGFAFDPVACEYALVEKAGVRMRLLIEGTGGSGASGTYRDEFNAKSFSGNDGSLSWNNTWQEINESDGPTKQDVRVKSDLGMDFSLRIRDNDGGGEGVWREADLSGCSSASLSFNYRRQDLGNSNDYVAVSVSGSDGGTWTELVQIAGPGTDSTYQPASFDISGAMSGDTQLRLLSSPTLGATDEVFFDNIEINCLP
ncbi:MAG: hypothetical protein KJO55_10760, partial [Gammaproteobacteria bacterium]|nr:hypothetical protein [Gammaproteobacteria bacterium]